MAATAKLVDGFIDFSHRDWGYRGDKGTWVRFDAATRRLTVQCASKGTLSSAYIEELCEFLAPFGVDFRGMHAGERVEVTIPESSASTTEAGQTQPEERPMSLTDCINALLARDNAAEIILRNGINVWDLYNLWEEARRNEEAYAGHYILQADGIYALDALGGIAGRRFEVYTCGWHGWPEVRATLDMTR